MRWGRGLRRCADRSQCGRDITTRYFSSARCARMPIESFEPCKDLAHLQHPFGGVLYQRVTIRDMRYDSDSISRSVINRPPTSSRIHPRI